MFDADAYKKKVLTLRFFEHQGFSWKQNWFSRIRAKCTKLEIPNIMIASSWDFVIIEHETTKRQTRLEHCIVTISYTYNVILSWVITVQLHACSKKNIGNITQDCITGHVFLHFRYNIYIKCFLTNKHAVSIIVRNILESTIFNQPKSLS